MPGEVFGPRKPYLSVIQGVLKQKVDETTPGAEKRTYETPRGDKGVKFELSFKSWGGFLVALRIKEGEYGQSLEVEFTDAILSLNTEDRYFSDFVKKIMSADLSKEISVSPYDFEVNGERKRGLNIYQGRDSENKKIKLKNFYWDDVDKKSCNGMPQPKGDTKQFKKDDWKVYFITVRQFLIEEVLKLNAILADLNKNRTQAEVIPTVAADPDELVSREEDSNEVENIDIDDFI